MTKTHQNIVLIVSDDQGHWALGCAGNRELRTPNLDALAEGGARFENAYCASPVCSPARASILTGMIPSQHGVHDWLRAGNCISESEAGGRMINYLEGCQTIPQQLAKAGYYCGLSGKWHLGDAHHAQQGYQFWRAHSRAGGDYMCAPMVEDGGELHFERRYVTDVITENALAFLDEASAQEQPFMLSINYTAPHAPWYRSNHPPEWFDPYFDDCPFESVPNEAKGPHAHRTDFFESPERRREKLAGYFGAITAMDAGIGKVIAELEAKGMREDTLVIFVSDNGMNMGHHGLCGKGNGSSPINLFETSVKVPLIVNQPGRVAEGVVAKGLYSQYDLAPTIAAFTGCAWDGASLPGRSLLNLLECGEEKEGESVVVFDEYGPTRMIRRGDWKLVFRPAATECELYDLAADPGELCNRALDSSCSEVLNSLRSELLSWFNKYSVAHLDASKLPVTGRGQRDRITLEKGGAECFPDEWLKEWWREGFAPEGEVRSKLK